MPADGDFIPTYFSHSYRPEDRAVNEFFWELFHSHGFAFTVDTRSGPLSTTHLEIMMRRSACFVGVVPCRDDQRRYKCSPFQVYEHGLALQARKPRLSFTEVGVSGRYFPEVQLRRESIFSRQRLPSPDRLSRIVAELAERSRADNSAGDLLVGHVGIVLPDGESGGPYAEVLREIYNLIESAGYSPFAMSTDFEDPFQFVQEADKCDFVVTDVASPEVPAWVYPMLHGRAVPTLKLAHIEPGGGFQPAIPPLVAGDSLRFARAENAIVHYWSTPTELTAQLNEELNKLYLPRRQFQDLEEGLRYFRSLGRSEGTVFLSNARGDDEFASQVGRAFDLQNISYFHYLYRNTIELGSDWSGQLMAKVEASRIFVPLLSKAYWQSEWCRREYEVAEQLRQEGRLTILPYFLDESSGQQVGIQGVNLTVVDSGKRIERIIADLDHEFLTQPRPLAPVALRGRRASRKPVEYAKAGPVDIAIVTVLREEYAAVHAQLEAPRPVVPTDEFPNQHAWVISSITAPGREAPYQVVLARGQKGREGALIAARNTIDAFQPAYVLLVGIAGGLSDRLRLGDVVVSNRIYGYGYGKVDRGSFHPRSDWNYPTDPGVAITADSMDDNHPWWPESITVPAPGTHGTTDHRPNVVVGPVASGDQVVDDLSGPMFREVLAAWPDLVAVEMESLGTFLAADDARQRARPAAFATIRGISDLPRDKGTGTAGNTGEPGENEERNLWKEYAAAAAAALTVQAIKLAWPYPPRQQTP
jgi:nucleoside phosphorylase